MKTVADFDALMGPFLLDEWHARGWSREEVRHALEHGIAAEHARDFEKLTKGAVPVSFWPKLIHPPQVLHKRLRSATVNDVSMHAEHRLAISKGHKDDAWTKALRGAGFSQNSLAKAVGVNQAVLSLHRQKLRKIPLSRAKAIEAKTGWPADARHWPCGIVSDEE